MGVFLEFNLINRLTRPVCVCVCVCVCMFSHCSRAGPRHKRTKRLLRAPWPPEGPKVAYMKLQFILFILIREMSMDSGNYTKAQYKIIK